jgi:hypothetical protein
VKRRWIALVVAAVATPSLASAQQHTRNGAVIGGVAGAVIGGIVGKQNDETPEGALIGGAVGAIAGGVAGHVRDQNARQRYYEQELARREQELYSQRRHAARHHAHGYPVQEVVSAPPGYRVLGYDTYGRPVYGPVAVDAYGYPIQTESISPIANQPLPSTAAPMQQGVSAADVIRMSRSGLSDDVICNHILANGVVEPLSVTQIIALHDQGISDEVITTMQQAASSSPPMTLAPHNGQPTSILVQPVEARRPNVNPNGPSYHSTGPTYSTTGAATYTRPVRRSTYRR